MKGIICRTEATESGTKMASNSTLGGVRSRQDSTRLLRRSPLSSSAISETHFRYFGFAFNDAASRPTIPLINGVKVVSPRG